MITVNIHEAKTNLSKLLAMVEHGEVITIAKAGHPIATIQPIVSTKPKRKPGSMKGQIWIADDFDDEIPKVTAAFEGKYDDSWDKLMGGQTYHVKISKNRLRRKSSKKRK